ncbi:unnamed protein product [Linum tenue]|uniref:Two-component response regulator n=1 Tax=Linum tenue TaxID=586396 RepID=A0AAV0K3F5_9ROSI|nr:unnamed protein product [Linum tenue]
MTVEQGVGGNQDQFPIGMRVLAVDDDLTCLMVLETLLRKCQYHVTTTSQARMALKILRERRNDFDLVISDVHMPDMDGFHLLEKVGLEMDLPVIMLSANGDPKVVMKGITHGACDYLLKPIRIEELKNIWQHVVRRKKTDNRSNVDSTVKPHSQSGEATSDHKLNKKRKDQNGEDDDDLDENGNDNDDPSSQKKPRVVWSVELHRKFVSAVNHLGIDKAVPKKILELMNVEKLSRENVASHLQKYRLYLRRISTVANQHANMAAALVSTDASYLQMGGSLTGYGLHNVAGNGQFHNGAGYISVNPNGMLGRLNSPAGMSIHGLPSSGMVQVASHVQGGRNHLTTNQRQFQSGISNADVLQGMPVSLELDQIQTNNKGLNYIRQHIPPATETTTAAFPPDMSMVVGSGSNGSFMVGASEKPLLLDHGRCNENWSNTSAHSTGSTTMFLDHCDVPSRSSLPIHLQGTKADSGCRVVSAGSNGAQMMSNAPQQGWDRLAAPSYNHFNNVGSSSVNLSIQDNGGVDMINQRWDANNASLLRTPSFSSAGQSNFLDTSSVKHNGLSVEIPRVSIARQPNQQHNLQTGHSHVGSLEDVAGFMTTREWTR